MSERNQPERQGIVDREGTEISMYLEFKFKSA